MHSARFLQRVVLLCLQGALIGQLWADLAPSPLPATVMPEQVSRSFSQPSMQPKLPGAPIQRPEAQPIVNNALAEKAKNLHFRLNKIILEGNHVYTDAVLRPLYQDKLNKVITVLDLFQIAQNITAFYRDNGYILSRAIIPPQHVANGVVKIQIIEGYISSVTVFGSPRGAAKLVKSMGDRIAAAHPLQVQVMERYLTLANEIPATHVKAVLAASKTVPAGADLGLETTNQPITGSLSYNNYGTRYIGPQQMTANVSGNSLIRSGDAINMTASKTPRGIEMTYADLNYNSPLGSGGSRLILGGNYTHTHPLFVLQSQKVDGATNNYYGNFQFPLIRERARLLTLATNFNYMDSAVNEYGNVQLYTDHLRPLSINGTYNFSDQWLGANLIYGEFKQGLPIFGYSSNTNEYTATTSRPGGRGAFTKIDGLMSRIQSIKGPVSLYGVVKGQWAFNPLLSSEQFVYGGSELGRGYDPAELIGDKGAAASLEARYDWNPSWTALQHMQFYIFYDFGAVWNMILNEGLLAKATALSTGVGTRFYINRYINGNLMWAQPITAPVTTLTETSQVVINGQTINQGNGFAPRVFFNITVQFD